MSALLPRLDVVDDRPCFYCHASGVSLSDRRPDLCDPCRELLSGFLIWLGRKPLPEREA